MAKRFTREAIRSILGDAHTDDIENAIIALHIGVVDQLKDERDQYKAEAEKLEGVQKELNDLKGGEDYKAKYENEHRDFEDYKSKVAQKEQETSVRAAYRKLLADEKISEKRLDAICKVTDFSGMKLGEDGNLADSDRLREAIRRDWGDFVTDTHEKGVAVETPPVVGKATKTKGEIMAIKDTHERQQAIAENHELFGF